MSADTSWCTRVCAGVTETQGSKPWNIYGDRAAPIFIWYEKSRLRRARGRPEKYTPVISLYLRPIRPSRLSPAPVHTPRSHPIRPFLFSKPGGLRPACFSRVPAAFLALPARQGGGGRTATAAFFHRGGGGPFYLDVLGFAESLNVASETC